MSRFFFFLTSFCTPSKLLWSVPTYFFSRLCQRTTGPEGQSTTRHRTRGPEDHRTRGPQDQRTTLKIFFPRNVIFFPGNVNLFSSIIPGGKGSRWVHYIGGVWGGFICGPYSIVKNLISTCVWCIKAQGSIGYLTDCRQSKRHVSYPYRSVERQRGSSAVAELFAPWTFTKMSPMMTMSHMR